MTRRTLRESQAAVALVRTRTPSGWAYLCQWSDSWHALHFVGGHREPGETFRECAAREVTEELLITADEFEVSAEPLARLEYVAFSESAGVPTWYVMAVFPTRLTADAVRAAEGRPENGWVAVADARRGATADGRRVSPTVSLILGKLGLLPPE